MLGLYGKTHYECEEFVDMHKFDDIQLDIYKGLAATKTISQQGYLVKNRYFSQSELSGTQSFKSLMQAYQEYCELTQDHDIKRIGEDIHKSYGYNALATFLKYAYSAHDLCGHYLFWDHYAGWRSNKNHRRLTEIATHFPTLIEWIDDLVTQNIFTNIGRVYIITIDSNGHSFEHRDPPLDPDLGSHVSPEFLHIRPNTNRKYYVYDRATNTKHYINSRVGWWNDRDIHGGEMCIEPSYAIRIDGIFSDAFKKKLEITES